MTVKSQIKQELFGLFEKGLWKTALSCHLSLPPNPGDVWKENCNVMAQAISRSILYCFFHTRAEGVCGILSGTNTYSTRRVNELFYFNLKLMLFSQLPLKGSFLTVLIDKTH